MTTRFVPVPGLPTWEAVVASSHTRPVLLFLHDPGCPASRRARRALEQLDWEIPLVDVRYTQTITREIERRTGVRHESPQVLLFQQGQAVWNADHGAITAQAVDAARWAMREDTMLGPTCDVGLEPAVEFPL